jgi:hypothetical protein
VAAVLGGGGAAELVEGEGDGCAFAVMRCGGPGSRRPPFIGGGGGFGKVRFFRRRGAPAARASSRSPAGRARSLGDGTARAETEVVEQPLGLFRRGAWWW